MTLKDTITKWHKAVCLLEQDQMSEASQSLKKIQNPSAKIVYNLGCIAMQARMYNDALEFFNSSLQQDQYLALSYFQRGVCHYEMKSFVLAEKDFTAAKSMITEESIDYRQLGAKIILDRNMIDSFSRSCRHHGNINMPTPIQSPFLDFIFFPPKKMVANLKKEDFLGKAKVISSVQEADIIYAEQKVEQNTLRKKDSPGASRDNATSNSPRSASKFQHLSHHSSSLGLSLTALPPSRPPPRLDRSRSLDNLLDDCNEENKAPAVRNLTVPIHDDVLQFKRQSMGEYYSHIPQDQTDSLSDYETLTVKQAHLSASSSALDRPSKKPPPVPKRPGTKPNTGSFPQHSQPNQDFQKVQEALNKKFTNLGLDKSNEKLPFQTAKQLSDKCEPLKLKVNKDVPQQTSGRNFPLRPVRGVTPPKSPIPLPKKDLGKTLRNVDFERDKVWNGKADCSTIPPNRPPMPMNRKSPTPPPRPVKPPRPSPPRTSE